MPCPTSKDFERWYAETRDRVAAPGDGAIDESHTADEEPTGTEYSRKWVVLGSVVASVLLATIDSSNVGVALLTMREAFATTFNAIQWVVLGYYLTMATTTLPLSRLGDVVGRRRIHIHGIAAFTLASVLYGIAPRSRS